MSLLNNLKNKKKLEDEQQQLEKHTNFSNTPSTFVSIINWIAFGFLAFLTLMMFSSEPPIDASNEDISVYKLSNTIPFLFYTLIAFLQLKHRELLP